MRDVVELPDVLLEFAPAAQRRVDGAGQPALVVDRALPEHGVELRSLRCSLGVGQGCCEALAFYSALLDTLECVRRGDTEEFVESGHHVDCVYVLLSRCLVGRDRRRPGHQAHVGDAALISGPALPVRERRIEGPCPTRVVVVVGRRAAQLIDVLQRQLGRRWYTVEEPPLIERPVGSPLAAGPVVGNRHDDRVVQLPGLL